MSEQTRADLMSDMAIEQRERAEQAEAENARLSARVARLEEALWIPRSELAIAASYADALLGHARACDEALQAIDAVLASKETPPTRTEHPSETTSRARALLKEWRRNASDVRGQVGHKTHIWSSCADELEQLLDALVKITDGDNVEAALAADETPHSSSVNSEEIYTPRRSPSGADGV